MKTFIFAIGGTGVRVLKSLTMLLASGVKGTSTDNEIIPIVIDYDGDNGDTKLTQDILECYQKIHENAYKEKKQSHQEHFFCTPIKSLGEIVNDPAIIAKEYRYGIPLEGIDNGTTFSGYINYDSLDVSNNTIPTRRLVESLYSSKYKNENINEDDMRAELHMNLRHGFRGNPNIGCVVTKQLTENKALQQLQGQIGEGDKVFIIGSIFGGTGASGIPMVLDFFKTGNNQGTFENTKVGVLAVTPYFNLIKVDEEKSPIDSNTFIAKTKAALKAYEDTVYKLADAVYMVGDDQTNAQFKNIEGGDDQKNNAHIVELIGAMMALDFIQRGDNELSHSFYQFGLKNNHDASTNLVYDDFYEQTTKPYFDPMARFVLFKHFCETYVLKKPWEQNDTWGEPTGLKDSLDFMKSNFAAFFEYFAEWIGQLENIKYRPFKLFNLNKKDYDDLFDYNRGGSIDESKIRTYLGESTTEIETNGVKNEEFYKGHPDELFMVNAHNALARM